MVGFDATYQGVARHEDGRIFAESDGPAAVVALGTMEQHLDRNWQFDLCDPLVAALRVDVS